MVAAIDRSLLYLGVGVGYFSILVLPASKKNELFAVLIGDWVCRKRGCGVCRNCLAHKVCRFHSMCVCLATPLARVVL